MVDISEFTVFGGDMTKRTHEALGNTLWAFNSKNLIKLARQRAEESDSKEVVGFVEETIVSVERVLERRKER